MADIKNNWNKYRNSRADIEMSKTGQPGKKKIGKMIICILH